jgi:serine protease Do
MPATKFLLEQNDNEIDGLVLSCVNQNIVLSGVIYDLDMSKDSATKLFRNLFRKADEFDNLLINEYGCIPRLQEG